MNFIRTLATLVVAFCLYTNIYGPTNWVQVAQQVRPSLGHMLMYDKQGTFAGSCTAFSINDQKDYFLTADHCKADVMKVNGNPALPIYADEVSDLMVLVVPEVGHYPALKLAGSEESGESVGAYGWGFGLQDPTFKAGEIAAPNVKIPDIATELEYGSLKDTYTVLDYTVIHGMSGGPVFNGKGEVVSLVQILSPAPDAVGVGRSLQEIRQKVGRYFTESQ